MSAYLTLTTQGSAILASAARSRHCMPLDKQPQAISQLDLETGRIDAITEDTLEAIALSRERRAALISAAVTGQIKATGRHRATAGAGGG